MSLRRHHESLARLHYLIKLNLHTFGHVPQISSTDFHPTVYSSTWLPTPKPEVVETHPAFHRVGPRGAWWVALLQGTGSGDPAFRRVRTRGPAAWFSSSSSALLSSSSSSSLRREIQFSAPSDQARRPVHRPFFRHSQFLYASQPAQLITYISTCIYRCNRKLWSSVSGADSKATYLCLGNHVFRGHSIPLLSTLVATSTVKIHIGEWW